MFNSYQSYKIIIYYTQDTEKFVRWAQAFWLLKTAHPIITVPIAHPSSCEPSLWIKTHLPSYTHLQGLIVPATLRPLIEIDFFMEENRDNKLCYLSDKSPCFCIYELTNTQFTPVDIQEVFEDLSTPEGKEKIGEEMTLMKEKLLMGI